MAYNTNNGVYVSVITLLPWSFGPGGPQRALKLALKYGCDGIQVVPLLGWRKKDIEEIPSYRVVSYEGAWNKGTVRSAIARAIKGDIPALWGPMLFGTNRMSSRKVDWFRDNFPDALAIDLGRDSAIEIAPGRFAYAKRSKIVIDLWHVREIASKKRSCADYVDRLTKDFDVRMIHFQTRNRPELDEFLDTDRGILRDLFNACPDNVPVVIELPPGCKSAIPRLAEKIRSI